MHVHVTKPQTATCWRSFVHTFARQRAALFPFCGQRKNERGGLHATLLYGRCSAELRAMSFTINHSSQRENKWCWEQSLRHRVDFLSAKLTYLFDKYLYNRTWHCEVRMESSSQTQKAKSELNRKFAPERHNASLWHNCLRTEYFFGRGGGGRLSE